MKDASSTPHGFKRYKVGNAELKKMLGIDWPGKILSVRDDHELFSDGFLVTMYVQPHELTGADRERYTVDAAVPVPRPEPGPAPAKAERRRWWR